MGTFRSFVLPVLVGSLLFSFAMMYVSFLAVLPALPLLFRVLLKHQSRKQAFYTGLLFGGASSLLLNAWMITVVTEYVKGSAAAGLLCYAASAIVSALAFALPFFLFSILYVPESRKFSTVHNALLMAALWVAAELLRGYFFSAMPWLSYSVGITQAGNLYFLQAAAIGGVYLPSFIVVASSYFIAYAFYAKRWKWLAVPVAMYLLQLAGGVLLFNGAKQGTERISVALIVPALSPETVWNDASAATLVPRLLALNERAVSAKPDLVVWTETVVPWTYAPDDDFLEAVTAKTGAAGAHTLIGMNTAMDSTSEVLSNSIYFLDPAGKNVGRYDKQDLLAAVERPLFSSEGDLILPFLASSGMKMRTGKNAAPLQTPWGKAGLLVCNESTSPGLARMLVENGASFLVNMGNDSWFSGHFISRQHFYNCRLRAVENRRDVLVNVNMGFAGVVRASGGIAAETDATSDGVQAVTVFPGSATPVSPVYFIVFVSMLFLGTVIRRFFSST